MRSIFLYLCSFMLLLLAACSQSNANADHELARIIIAPMGAINGSYLVEVSEKGQFTLWRVNRTVKYAFNKERIYKKDYIKEKERLADKQLNAAEMKRLKSLLNKIDSYEKMESDFAITHVDYFFIGYKGKTYSFDSGIVDSLIYSYDPLSEEEALRLTEALTFEELLQTVKELTPVTPGDWRF